MIRSHAEKRLDARASPAAIERGLALLRDRVALGEFIGRLGDASVDVRAAERVAFALGPGDHVAHAIVARDGTAVTTLGAGMAFTWPRVPWPVVEGYLKNQEQVLAAKRALHSLKDVDDDVSPLLRYVRHPHRLVRREWEVLKAMEPLLGDMYAEGVRSAISGVIQPVAVGTTISDVVGDDLWRIYVGGAVSITLLADVAGPERTLFAACAAVDLILGARALWSLANRPASTLATLASLAPLLQETPLLPIAATTVLDAVAFRNPGFAKEARRLSKALVPDVAVDDDDDAVLKDARRATTVLLPALLRRFVPNVAVFSDASVVERVAACDANDDDACAAAAGGWHNDVWKIWRPLSARLEPPRLALRHPNGITDADDAGITLWRSLLRHHDEALLRRPSLARLITLAPFEALVPPVDVDADWKLSDGARYLQQTLPRIIRGNDLPATTTTPKKTPVTAAKKTPPNAACWCGSGKKFKKCHGKA